MKTKEQPSTQKKIDPPEQSREALEKIVTILSNLPDKEKLRVLETVCVWCDFRPRASY
jgi:hypothetical protein